MICLMVLCYALWHAQRKTIEEIPSDYLKWMSEELTDNEDLMIEAENEYEFREKHGTHIWS